MNVGVGFVESPRARRSSRFLLDDLLASPKDMKRIEDLEMELSEQDSHLADLDVALGNMRETCRIDRDEKHKEQEQIQEVINDCEKTLASGTRNMDEWSPLHEYMNVVKKTSGSIADSTYVLKLESMLLKCLHQMGVLESQLRMAELGTEYQVKVFRDEIKQLTDERSRMELQYLNRIVLLDTEIHTIRMKHQSTLLEDGKGVENVPYLGWKKDDCDELRNNNTWSFLSRQDKPEPNKRRGSSTSGRRSYIGKGA